MTFVNVDEFCVASVMSACMLPILAAFVIAGMEGVMKGTIVCLIGGVVLAGGLGAMTRTPQQAPPPQAAAAAAAPSALPDGAGRELTQRVCGQCHSVGMFATQRHSQDEWNQVISRMMAKGMTASEDDLYEISDYLAENLGKPAPAPGG